ncbi:MAG: hypothetical protein Kow0060_23390 [Methylohalobius crimeensis]
MIAKLDPVIPMTSVIQFYEQLSSAPDDKTRARLIAEAFERMEERYPEVRDLATQSGLNETELRLQKEIEIVRKEIAEAEGRLAKEIETVRKEIVEIEARLAKEIEVVRKEIVEAEGRLAKEIETVRKEIVEVEARLAKEIETVRKEVVEAEGRLTREIEQVRASTLRWLVSLMTGQTALIIAALFAIAGK